MVLDRARRWWNRNVPNKCGSMWAACIGYRNLYRLYRSRSRSMYITYGSVTACGSSVVSFILSNRLHPTEESFEQIWDTASAYWHVWRVRFPQTGGDPHISQLRAALLHGLAVAGAGIVLGDMCLGRLAKRSPPLVFSFWPALWSICLIWGLDHNFTN